MMTVPKKKVVLVQKMFASYRKPVFDLLAQQIDLLVLHGHNYSGIETAESNFSRKIPSIQYWHNDTNVILFPLFHLLKFRPKVVILEFALGLINLPLIILICKMYGIKCAFWSHGYDRSIGFKPETRLSDKYRLLLMKWVGANIVYGKEDRDVLQPYLTKSEIFIAQNTLDTISASKIRKELELEGKVGIKERLRVYHEFNLIFIGRMIASKKPELLIEMYEQLKSKYNLVVGVHFIGDGPMLEKIKEEIQEKSIETDFYLHGAVYDDVKNGELLFISDLMVMPGYLGLSVNHALCFGCPVLSFKKINGYPSHSPEVEYVIPDKTGFLLEEHSASAMAVAAHKLFMDNNLKDEFQENIRLMVTDVFPLEKMVGGVVDCVDYLTRH